MDDKQRGLISELTPRPRPRRSQERPALGESLALDNPEVKEVLDTNSGEHLHVAQVMGSEYESLIQLRMSVRTAMQKGDPLFRCSLCGVAVYICRAKTQPKFYFKHQHENGSCPAQTKGKLSQAEINALKYNGAKESKLHRAMKDWVSQCLAIDHRFSDIAQEPIWKGAITPERRRPDVRATYKGLPIAFEIQLSTTYLDVIAARRDFYMREGGLLIWLFAEFDVDHRRMTDDDCFYNNNLNAFVINKRTVETSLQVNEFKLDCVWVQPFKNGGHSGLHRRTISFSELTLDPSKQQAFYYDFAAAKRSIAADLLTEEQNRLRTDFEAWIGIAGYYGLNGKTEWQTFRSRFGKHNIDLPLKFSDTYRSLLTCLYSAKNGRPWGPKYKLLVEVAHRLSNAHKSNLIWFMHALKTYRTIAIVTKQDRTRLWEERYKELKTEYPNNKTAFIPPKECLPLLNFLFPELRPLPGVRQ